MVAAADSDCDTCFSASIRSAAAFCGLIPRRDLKTTETLLCNPERFGTITFIESLSCRRVLDDCHLFASSELEFGLHHSQICEWLAAAAYDRSGIVFESNQFVFRVEHNMHAVDDRLTGAQFRFSSAAFIRAVEQAADRPLERQCPCEADIPLAKTKVTDAPDVFAQ